MQNTLTVIKTSKRLTLFRYPLFDFLTVVDVSDAGARWRRCKMMLVTNHCFMVQHLRQAQLRWLHIQHKYTSHVHYFPYTNIVNSMESYLVFCIASSNKNCLNLLTTQNIVCFHLLQRLKCVYYVNIMRG